MKAGRLKVTKLSADWFVGKIPGAAFFAESEKQVEFKANNWNRIDAVVSSARLVSKKKSNLRLVG